MSSNLHWTSTLLLAIPASLDDRSDTVAAFVSLARDNDWYGKLIIEEDGDNLLLKLVKEGKPEGQENVAAAIGLLRRDPESVEHMIHVGVCSMQLLNLNLSGTLSPEIRRLSYMQILDIMWNNIGGSIPKEIDQLTSLKFLLLNGNNLTGSMPEDIGNLPNLNRIQIDQNHISGPIPVLIIFFPILCPFTDCYHQFLSNGTFPQQPQQGGGMYLALPVVSASNSKYPLQQYKARKQ
ncbi:unnamed protein product [Lactuca saligna]|uniref:Uncharacterized protein n=1 Tax=Lactuca saligna TaxID=75948 RepID=A0AA35Z3S8_LACSI|nr:unnamed protein product [Lactuca saligna]